MYNTLKFLVAAHSLSNAYKSTKFTIFEWSKPQTPNDFKTEFLSSNLYLAMTKQSSDSSPYVTNNQLKMKCALPGSSNQLLSLSNQVDIWTA